MRCNRLIQRLVFREWNEEWFDVVIRSVGLDVDLAAMPMGQQTVSG
jgi:hypothetical protein